MFERPLGVVLAAGLGTRLRPLTPALPKALVPLLNRPVLAYALELCGALGLRDAVVVIGPGQDVTAEAARACAPPGLATAIAVQREPRGPGDALVSVGARLDGRAVVVIAVDTLIRGDLRPLLDAFEDSGALAGLPLHHTDRPREMGIAELEGDRVVWLEEKPQHPRSQIAVVGIWMLAAAAVERVRARPVINARGESDLTATVAALVAEGANVRGWRVVGEWLDVGTLDSLLHAQRLLLAELRPAPPPADAASRLSGTIAAGPGTRVVASRLEGPLLLGANAVVERCELGPNVVVGDGAELRGVRLRDALVAPGARIAEIAGSGVVVSAAGEVAVASAPAR